MLIGRKRKVRIPRRRRQYHSIYTFAKGLKKDIPSTMLPEQYTPNCKDFLFRDGIALKARGTSYFASTDTSPLIGTIMGFDQYYKTDGTEKLLCFTTKHIFSYNTSTETFECITPSTLISDCETAWTANTNVTADTSTDKKRGSKSVKITISSDFTTGVAAYLNFTAKDLSSHTDLYLWIKSSVATSAGDLKIRISEANDGATTSDYEDVSMPALSANTWTMVTVAFSGAGTTRDAVLSVSLVVSTDLGEQVVYLDDIRAVTTFTGDEDDFFTGEIMSDLYIFSNGIDGIYKRDMSSDCCSELSGTSGWSAKKVLKFGERLCLFHTVESGTRYPQRVRWSVAGDPEDWTGTGSGYSDLITTLGVDWIQTAEKIGNYVVIYAERTIALMEYTGDVNNPFSFVTRVSGVGLAAPRCIVNFGDEHLFLCWDGFYSYVGGRSVEKIGDNIRDYLMSTVNPEYIGRSFAVYLEENEECKFFLPTGTSTTPNAYFTYNLKSGAWSKGERSYTGFGYYSRRESLTIDDMTDEIDSYTWLRFDDTKVLALAPLTLYGDSNGKVYKDDESTMNLAGQAIDGYVETKDFVQGERYRGTLTYWCELNFEARGSSVTISYSVDGGSTWTGSKTFTLSGEWEEYRWDLEVYSEMIRFRFRNNESGENLEIRQIEVGFIGLSDRGVG